MMELSVVIIQLVFALFLATVWAWCAHYVRRHPEKMSGYNAMPREKLDKIDLPRIGRFVSNMMFTAIPFILASPFMPNQDISVAMLASPPIILCIVAALYINIFEKRFYKRR